MKRNPNDSTFRNINALKKRVTLLEKALNNLTDRVNKLLGDQVKEIWRKEYESSRIKRKIK